MRLQAAFTKEEFVTNKSIQSLIPLNGAPAIEVISAILNSKLVSWYFLIHSNVGQRNDFPKIVLKQTRELPFPIKISKSEAKNLESLSKELALYSRRIRDGGESALVDRKIETLEARIDKVVYRLFGLNERGVRLIEAFDLIGKDSDVLENVGVA